MNAHLLYISPLFRLLGLNKPPIELARVSIEEAAGGGKSSEHLGGICERC